MATADQLLDEELALEHELALERAREGLLGYVTATNDAYEVNWHHRRICMAIDAMHRGWTHRQLLEAFGIHGDELRRQLDEPHPTTGLFAGLTHPSAIDARLRSLHIAVPPRMGKSTLASMAMPAWWFGKDPNAQIISTSYSADLASRINRQVQREIDNPRYAAIFPKTRLNAKNVKTVAQNSYLRNSDLFEIVDHKGVYRSAGVAGGVTGMGASCVIGSTQVACPGGPRSIKEIVDGGVGSQVYAYDVKRQIVVVSRVIAVRRLRAAATCTIRTVAGYALECTPEHLVWARPHGYRAAAHLERGQQLIGLKAGWPKKKQLRRLRVTYCKLRAFVWKLLQIPPQIFRCSSMRQLRQNVHAAYVRVQQIFKSKKGVGILRPCVSQSSIELRQNSLMRCVRQSHAGKRRSLVFRGLSQSRGICCAQTTSWLRRALQKIETFCSAARQVYMRYMSKAGSAYRDVHSSHRPQRPQSQGGQFDNFVSALSHSQPRAWDLQCSGIEANSDSAQWVYDIQVERWGNFFGNSILVSNCAIIDDPVKNRDQADSQVVREGVWEWYASTLYTRLHKGAVKLLIQTRWHEDDLGGRVLAQAKSDQFSDQWFGLIYPAILDAEPTPGDPREQGEAMWPSHFPLDQMNITRATIGTYEFEALYQQRPAPREGGVIKTSWLQYYTRLPDGLTSYTMSADLTFGSRTTSKGDFVAIQVWACAGADRYLIDQIHARMEFTEQIRALKTMSGKYPMCRLKLIEDAANGRAAISVLRSEIQGLVPVRAIGSKQARLEAVSPQVEAGNVYLPSPSIAPWVQTNVHELASFPNGAHDDTIDAMVYALDRLSPTRRSYASSLPVSLKKGDPMGGYR